MQSVAADAATGLVATGGNDGKVQAWSWSEAPLAPGAAVPHGGAEPGPGLVRAPTFDVDAHTNAVHAVAASGDGRIASASEDGTVCIWRLPGPPPAEPSGGAHRAVHAGTNGRGGGGRGPVARLRAAEGTQGGGMLCVAFSPDCCLLLTGGYGGEASLWQLGERGTQQPTQPAEDAPPVCVHAEPAACRHTPTARPTYVYAVAFADRGRRALYGTAAGSIGVFGVATDGATGRCVGTTRGRVLSGHTKRVVALACSDARGQFASASDDRSIRLWRTCDGMCVATLTGQCHAPMPRPCLRVGWGVSIVCLSPHAWGGW